jgi:hypothetical protein
VGEQCAFDDDRIDVGASADDEVIGATHVDEAVLVAPAAQMSVMVDGQCLASQFCCGAAVRLCRLCMYAV